MIDQLMSEFLLTSPLLPSLSQLTFTILVALVSSAITMASYGQHFNANNSSRQFKLTVLIVGVVACLLTIVVGSNLARAFGLFGSFSLIRFRKSFKRTEEIAFLFWSISCGVAVGAGLHVGAILISIILYWSVYLYLQKINPGGIVNFGVCIVTTADAWKPALTEIQLRLRRLNIQCAYDQEKTILTPNLNQIAIYVKGWSQEGFDVETIQKHLSEMDKVTSVTLIS